MQRDRRLKGYNLLSRKCLTVSFIGMLLVFACRSESQEQDVVLRKDVLVEMSQSEREAHLKRLLDSSSPNDQAWGAYWTAKYGMTQFAPQLIHLIDPSVSRKSAELLFRDLAMFDSLIQLSASVPSARLMPLYDRYPDHVLILLAKSPRENHQALLDLAKKELRGSIYWMTACNLLKMVKAPGFAVLLLKEIKIEIEIAVHEKYGTGVRGGIIRDPGGVLTVRSYDKSAPFVSLDLPPIDNYILTKVRNETSSVVAEGKTTIYYMREACYPGPGNPLIGKYGKILVVQGKPADYLMGLTEKIVPKTDYFFTIDWENSEQFSEEISRICNEVHAPFRSVLNNLLSSGWLTESEAETAGIYVSFKFFDLRGNPSVSLSSVPAWCERIKLSK
jgi:hypothetical protein